MQPISRFVPRLFIDSIPLSKPIRIFRIPNRPSLKQSSFSICLQCKIRSQSQKRLFADSTKPPPPPQSPDSSPNSIPLPPPAEINSVHANTNTYLSSDQHEDAPTDLPSTADERRSAINQRFSHLMDNMQGNIFLASQRINDLTGYSGIEALKARIVALEKRVQASQDGVRSSRLKYKTTVAERAATQREVTTLLARKDSWNPLDLERFTSLYRMDHTNEQAVQEAATKLAEAEREAEVAAGKLSSSILSRYHEEQIWSDKIRRMSTWGTWGLMGVNCLLFLVFQFGFEPWRRARLVHGFEEKVKEALDKEREERVLRRNAAGIEEGVVPMQALLADGNQELEISGEAEKPPAVDAIIAAIDEVISEEENPTVETTEAVIIEESQEPTTTLTKLKNLWQPESWKAEAQDLFSPRKIQMRKQDVTIIALEGVATGAIIAIIATFFRPS